MTSNETDLMRYIVDLNAIESHLLAAGHKAVGIYATNPGSTGAPTMEHLHGQIEGIRENVAAARLTAWKLLHVPA